MCEGGEGVFGAGDDIVVDQIADAVCNCSHLVPLFTVSWITV